MIIFQYLLYLSNLKQQAIDRTEVITQLCIHIQKIYLPLMEVRASSGACFQRSHWSICSLHIYLLFH